MSALRVKGDASIVLCGAAGQGIQTVEHLLTRILKQAGYHVFSSSEFMSRIRGGSNSTEIRISSRPVSAFVDRVDILFAFNETAIPHLQAQGRISPDTVIVGEEANLRGATNPTHEIPLTEIATEVGNRIYANTVAVGVVAGLLGVDTQIMAGYLRQHFAKRSEEIISANVEAGQRGYAIGRSLVDSGQIEIDIPTDDQAPGHLLVSGTEAVALGAIGGGCDFISSYPMSPSTGVLVFLAQNGADMDIVVEQAEDEIAALNMALGASYAGARSMVTTSGGGFALMTEALSLSGVAELPVVIHLAQRPGPGTGMPTRTEQGDLLFALFAGHGEFPRIILAPGSAEDAFHVTTKAFNLAARYQVPVIILTDQYFVDSVYQVPSLDLSGLSVEKHIVETTRKYKRYAFATSGISPRGVPGYGDGIAVADSHEHDELGHMTENLALRVQMNDKRLRKLEGIERDLMAPELIGSPEYETLVIGWGSTYHAIEEALERLGRSDIAFLHFKQVYPLHPDIVAYLNRAAQAVVVENNATGQFAKLIKLEAGIDVENRILKYDGMPFSVEELVTKIAAVADGAG